MKDWLESAIDRLDNFITWPITAADGKPWPVRLLLFILWFPWVFLVAGPTILLVGIPWMVVEFIESGERK